MKKKVENKALHEEYGIPCEENPEWTAKMFANAKQFHELAPEMQKMLRELQAGNVQIEV